MSCWEEYKCDICNDLIDKMNDPHARAVRFCSNTSFEFVILTHPNAKGTHIDGKCMKQLRQLFLEAPNDRK